MARVKLAVLLAATCYASLPRAGAAAGLRERARVGAPELLSKAMDKLAPGTALQATSCHNYDSCSTCLLGSSTHIASLIPYRTEVHG